MNAFALIWLFDFVAYVEAAASDPHLVKEKAAGVGLFGGSCTCPDGKVYQVGDNEDDCASLACVGGVSGTCKRDEGSWSHRKVECREAVACLTGWLQLGQAGDDVPAWGLAATEHKANKDNQAICAAQCLASADCASYEYRDASPNCRLNNWNTTEAASKAQIRSVGRHGPFKISVLLNRVKAKLVNEKF